MALPWSFVSKITNSKHQISNKSQIPNHKFQTRAKAIFFILLFVILNFGHAQRRRLRRVLEFICYLCFVIWDFPFRSLKMG